MHRTVMSVLLVCVVLCGSVLADECETPPAPLDACVIVQGAQVDVSWLDLPNAAFFCVTEFANGMVHSGDCERPFLGDPISPEYHTKLYTLSLPGNYEFQVTAYIKGTWAVVRSGRLHVSCILASDGAFGCE